MSKVWKILLQTKKKIKNDNISMVSPAVAFYLFLGIFPLLAAFISLYGLFSSPDDVKNVVELAKGVVPPDILNILKGELSRLVESGIAGNAAIISFMATLWSGAKATRGMMNALSHIHGGEDKRNFFFKSLIGIGLTFAGMVLGVVLVVLLAGLPMAISFFHLGGMPYYILQALRWVLMGLTVAFGISLFYRYAPYRPGEKWKMLTPGAITATMAWLVASGLFSWFVGSFGNFNKTYGSLGAIAVLMLWLSLSAYVFILGAELDQSIRESK